MWTGPWVPCCVCGHRCDHRGMCVCVCVCRSWDPPARAPSGWGSAIPPLPQRACEEVSSGPLGVATSVSILLRLTRVVADVGGSVLVHGESWAVTGDRLPPTPPHPRPVPPHGTGTGPGPPHLKEGSGVSRAQDTWAPPGKVWAEACPVRVARMAGEALGPSRGPTWLVGKPWSGEAGAGPHRGWERESWMGRQRRSAEGPSRGSRQPWPPAGGLAG